MSTTHRFCVKCGQPMPAEAVFCPACGTQVPLPVGVAPHATHAESVATLPAGSLDSFHTINPTSVMTAAGVRPKFGDAQFLAGDQLGPRYTVIKLLGVGGMGAVYHAFDHELGVGVAVKVIRPALQADATAARDLEQRFKRELVLARQITHKHVVRIHDIGEIDGVKYLTMPYIDGETLAELLRRDGKLPIARAIAIVTQVAAGLAAAHAKGVVHRDLKPENIMIEQETGDALIMDFGIARSVESGSTQTAAGSIVGTLEYMAPEQAQGMKVDGRTDIYALGLVLYDCLVGRQRLMKAENPMTEMLTRIGSAPAPPRTIDGNIPEPLDLIVQRAVSPSPESRFESTAALVAALEGLTPEGHVRTAPGTGPAMVIAPPRRPAWHFAVAAVLVIAAAVGGSLLTNRNAASAPPVARDPISVLVAQFENKTGDAVFDGVLEQALSLNLEAATFITAYPQNLALRSAAAIKPGSRLDEPTARLVATRDGIKLVLAGAIAPSGSGYDITVRAIDAADGKDVASANETARDKSAVLAALGEAATDLRQELGDAGAQTDDGRETFTAASLEAARAYVLGGELAAAGKFNEAIAHYQEAVQRDPEFGRAYSGWATAAFRAGRPAEAEEQGKKALALMDRMTEREKYRTLGTYYLGAGANDEQAVENYRMLIEKYPSDGPGLNNLAVAYFRVLDFKRAAEQGQRAAVVYPNSLNYRTNVALYAMYAGDFATAVAEAKNAIALGRFDKSYLPIAIAALATGRADEARAAYAEMAKVGTRGASIASMGRADVDMYLGRFDEAQRELESGAASDEAGKLVAPRALKLIALAEIAAATGKNVPAVATLLSQAAAASSADAVLVPAGRMLAAAGRTDAAAAHAATLEKQVRKRGRALGAVIRAEMALAANRPLAAIDALTEARTLADLWLIRFMLGRAYVEQGRYVEAVAELEACERRIGEASDVFLDDWPTFRYTVPVKYWLARAHDGLGNKDSARKNYESYLALRETVAGDPLAADARKRISR